MDIQNSAKKLIHHYDELTAEDRDGLIELLKKAKNEATAATLIEAAYPVTGVQAVLEG